MLFPQQKAIDSPEAKSKSEELEDEPSANIAFVPLAMPSTAGPGTIAMIISSASTVRQSSTFADWVLMVAPPLDLFPGGGYFVGKSTQLWRNYAAGGQGGY